MPGNIHIGKHVPRLGTLHAWPKLALKVRAKKRPLYPPPSVCMAFPTLNSSHCQILIRRALEGSRRFVFATRLPSAQMEATVVEVVQVSHSLLSASSLSPLCLLIRSSLSLFLLSASAVCFISPFLSFQLLLDSIPLEYIVSCHTLAIAVSLVFYVSICHCVCARRRCCQMAVRWWLAGECCAL